MVTYKSIEEKRKASKKRKYWNKLLVRIRDVNPKQCGILALVDLRYNIKQENGLV